MEILYILLILLVITRVLGEVLERLGQPQLVGELVAGILLGMALPVLSGDLEFLQGLPDNEIFTAVTDLGIFFLMLMAGTELRPSELASASREAVAVAVGGMALPFASGFLFAWLFIPQSDMWLAQALFVATALSITAVPVAVKVLMDLGKLKSRAGHTLVSAAVYDDILSLLLLAVLTAVLRTGGFPGAWDLLLLVGKIALFFAITLPFGRWAFPWLGRFLKRGKLQELEFSMLLIAALSYAALAELLGLHFIVGAFLAGLFFGRRTVDKAVYEDVKNKVSGVTTGFLAPIFFASIGLHLDLKAATVIPVALGVLIVFAILGKLLGGGLTARAMGLTRQDAAIVGMGMSARGAVELIIAGIAMQAGLFSGPDVPEVVQYLFSAIVIVAIVTTVITPIGINLMMRRAPHPPEDEGKEKGSG